MSKSRRQDTRPEESRRDEVQKLKAIIRALKKENAQLRKRLGKMSSFEEDYKTLLEETDMAPREPIPEPKETCPECAHAVTVTDLGKITLLTCKNCSWRSRKK